MARYVIGDVQGCWDSLEALAAQMPINPRRDQLWFVGDLVNRGPKSLKVLRRLMSAGRSAVSVLGNHDLHLLALAAGVRKPQPLDTIQQVLRARDAADLIDWLRRRPLAYHDGDTLMVHAGVLPHWTLRHTMSLAHEVSLRLKSHHWKDFLAEMVSGTKPHWADGIKGQKRMRAALSVFTRLRYLDARGIPEFKNKLAPEQVTGLTPWFDMPDRKTQSQRIVFGHWSTLGLVVRPNLIGLDTGCVWGRQLSAIRLEDHKVYLQSSLEPAVKEE
ncbi:MAG: symmetrical bis(5'-nucleosyl)-tetraphosphatase [Burkholderiaceae bacterium]|nr:symmetrical bis(5'-nucleosyl)-tetraphosphatase [Burkholderiaceae bacterium]